MRPYALLVPLARCPFAAPAGAQPALPSASTPPASEPVVETRFGITTTDPFRRLEDLDDPKVQAWMKAEADRTRTILDSIPGRAGVLRQIERLAQATTSRIHDAEILRDGRMLVLRQDAGEDIPRLMVPGDVEATGGRRTEERRVGKECVRTV